MFKILLNKLIKRYSIASLILYGAIFFEIILCIILYIILLKVKGV